MNEIEGNKQENGIKIAISGKGGVGKSTVAAVWSRILSDRGYKIVAIDADPDANLAHALGIPKKFRSQIRPLSNEKDLIECRTGAKPGIAGQIFTLNPRVDDLLEKYALNYKNIDLIVLGAVKKGGAGCACPESTLLKSLVRHCVLKNDEVVILDMEAGIEHLGRGTAIGVDALVIVTESGSRSFETASHISKLSSDIGIESKLSLLLNKNRCLKTTMSLCSEKMPEIPVLGSIPYDERFVICDEQEASVYDNLDENQDLIKYFTFALDSLLLRTRSKSIPSPFNSI